MSRYIHQNEGVAKTSHQDAVSESNVHMDNVQEVRFSSINIAPSFSLWDCSIRPKSQWKLSAIKSLAVKAGLENVFVISETTTAQSLMKFFRSPMSLCVGTISPITRANRGKKGTLAMNQSGNIIPGECGKESRRTRRKVSGTWRLRRGRGRNVRLQRWRCRHLLLVIAGRITKLLPM